MKCQKCGHENPEYIAYCGECGELLRASMPASQTHEEGIGSIPDSNDSALQTEIQTQTNSTKSHRLQAAAIVASIGVILLIATLALNIYWYELIIDDFVDHEPPYDDSNWELRINVGKAMAYSEMTGYICVALTLLLLVQSCIARYRKGASFNRNMFGSLVQMRYLVIVALICVTAAFCLYLFLVEVQPDLSGELGLRLSSLVSILRQVAWVTLAVMLFLVARRI
ncbi:MAG: zinc ribbon domain-containing protein [Methanobacteriota archaeon]|nr:MAG: zinc ribbon domain-containing protein [Euryarchaeota archaeon]